MPWTSAQGDVAQDFVEPQDLVGCCHKPLITSVWAHHYLHADPSPLQGFDEGHKIRVVCYKRDAIDVWSQIQ